jgi:hypothetical protein
MVFFRIFYENNKIKIDFIKYFDYSIMIAIEKTNEKGDKITYYTHLNYMSKEYNHQISRYT